MLGHKIDWEPGLLEKIGITTEQILKIPRNLIEYYKFYIECFKNIHQRIFGFMYLIGLMSGLERKSLEPIALSLSNNSYTVRQLQYFVTGSNWDVEKVSRKYRYRVSQRIDDEDGMITFDETDFKKKGKNSAGVMRQYCGVVGATENCQAGIFMGYTGKKGYSLLDSRLYVPEVWFDESNEERLKKCKFPENVKFKDKCAICMELFEKVINENLFSVKWVGADSTFGSDHKFRHNISGLNLYYFVNIRSNTCIWSQMPQMRRSKRKSKDGSIKYKPMGKPVSVKDFIENDNSNPWIEKIIAEGSKGPIRAHIKIFRVYENINGMPGDEVWLYVRKYADGEVKYLFCNAPEDTPVEVLDKKSVSRWPIEQCFEECKTELGMDNYEVRSYNGWHRHMMFVMMAHEFLCEVQNMFKKNSNYRKISGNRI